MEILRGVMCKNSVFELNVGGIRELVQADGIHYLLMFGMLGQ